MRQNFSCCGTPPFPTLPDPPPYPLTRPPPTNAWIVRPSPTELLVKVANKKKVKISLGPIHYAHAPLQAQCAWPPAAAAHHGQYRLSASGPSISSGLHFLVALPPLSLVTQWILRFSIPESSSSSFLLPFAHTFFPPSPLLSLFSSSSHKQKHHHISSPNQPPTTTTPSQWLPASSLLAWLPRWPPRLSALPSVPPWPLPSA